MQCVSFWDGLSALSIISLKLVQYVYVLIAAFYCWVVFHGMDLYYNLFSYSPSKTGLDNFQVLFIKYKVSMDICTSSVYPLWQNFFCTFLVGYFLFYYWILRVLHFTQKSFFRYVIWDYFLLVCNLSFHPLTSIFHRAKVLNFDEVHPLYQLFPL